MSRIEVWLAVLLVFVALGALAAVVFIPTASGDPGELRSSERVAELRRELGSLAPRGTYVLVDTGANRLYLKRNGEVLMEAVCSTGSRRTLISEDRRWTFETPRGIHAIRSKVRNPVWRRPDWAFLEEGNPVPTREAERYEEGVLGEYALDIGNGYFIHGTLYSRLLGQNVTHGCIRLGDRDLEFLARRAPVGTKVYIY